MEMTELLPTHVQTPVKFHPVTLENLEQVDNVNSFSLGNFSANDNYVWVTRGSCIEVLNKHTAQRCGAWSFGTITKEASTCISCVIEMNYGTEPLLLIGLHCRGVGMLCVFSPVKSKIVTAIELPSKVVSLEKIAITHHNEVMISYLQSFSGLVAVGMEGGLVYLLDLCLDQPSSFDETQPASVNAIPASTPQIHSIRESMDASEYLAIVLDNESCSRGLYSYRRPDGKSLQSFNATDVCVTSMKYIPQLGSLIIGMNFGCFQIWKMDRLMLEYSSPYEADLAPITHFIYQEPENDPKKFVYMWIGRGPTFMDRRDGDCSALSLYQLSYDNKRVLRGHGQLYSNLESVMHKFEHPLTTDPYNVNGLNVYDSTLIQCEVISDAAYQKVSRREEGIEDHHDDSSLCAFLWNASTDPESKPVYLLGIFDLNRWYHAQMPHSVRPANLCHGVCPFFAFCNLEDIVEIAGPECMLAALIAKDSVTRYRSTVTPSPEQHFYPSALAFDLHCLLENSLVDIHFSGVQKQILYDLRKNNNGAIVEPTDTFNRCSLAEILPKFCDGNGELNVSEQREALLSVCVENAMTDVILGCINSWADGEYSRSGCTLRLILNTSWTRVVKAKETIDRTCVPLFDCSVTGVDKQTVSLLHQQQAELGRLCRVFQQLLNLAATTTEQGAHDLQVKLNVTSLLHEYMQVLTWLVVVGLLPETIEGDSTTGKYNYPSESLSQAFILRRQELNSLHQDLALTDLLMIDGLIDHIGGQVKDLWNKEGGNGLYPPPSLHAALGVYLLEDVPINAKHCVLFYLMLDLISFASDTDQKLVQEASLFAQCFGMSPSLARLVQGFWLLDHRDFNEALHVLLDPIINKQDLAAWQHTRIVRAFLYQEEPKSALMYLSIRLPNPETPDDIKLELTALLASGNINQAFEYQRKRRDPSNCLDLIEHFFAGCMQTSNLGRLVQLPLDNFEDKQLAEFLRNTSTCESMELLVMYYLQRCRYVEAIRLNEQIQKLRVVDTNPHVIHRAIARDAIIQAHVKNLPEVQRELVRSKRQDDLPMRRDRIELCRPKPLSTTVNENTTNQINSRATLICAVMEKVQEVHHADPDSMDKSEEPKEVFMSLPALPKPKHALEDSAIHAQSTMEKDLSQFLKRTPPMSGRSPLSKISESAKRRMQKYQNAEAMSLLATPPVKRVARSRVKPHATPQSILKVRNTVQQSPLVKARVDDKKPSARKNPFVTMSSSPLALNSDTPKLLRFVLSPSRSCSQTSQSSSQTSQTSSQTSSQTAKSEEERSPEQKPEPEPGHDDTVMTQVVDEEITFNFSSVSHLKMPDRMDTEQDCPPTPPEVDDRRTPSPEIKPPSSEESSPQTFTTPKQLRFTDIQTPREQISHFVETMDTVEMKRPDSAKKYLASVRAEYEMSKAAEAPDSVSDESDESEQEEEDAKQTDEKTEDSSDIEEIHSEMKDEPIVEAPARVVQTPREFARHVRESPEASPFKLEPSEPASLPKPRATRFAAKQKIEVSQLVREAKEVAKSVTKVVPKKEPMTPPRMSPELKKFPAPVEVIEIESSSQSEGEDPCLKPMPESDPEESSPAEASRSPRRSPRIAKRISLEDLSPEKRSERQSSPLMSDAFMMKLRHTPRGSREPTPETFGEEPIQFTFSNPVTMDAEPSTSMTPSSKPFIFSPPVTRSRGKRRDNESMRSLRSSILDPGANVTGLLDVSLSDSALDHLDQSSVFETSQSQSRSAKKTRRKIAVDSVSDSPINFISPVATSASDSDVMRSGKPGPKMKLRTRFKVVQPERKSVRLMKK